MSALVIRHSPQNALAVSAEDYLIYNLQSGQLHRLNPSAALAFELCGSGRAMVDLLNFLAALPTVSTSDWESWLRQAVSDGLLTLFDCTESTETIPAAADFAGEAMRLRNEGQTLAAYVCQAQAVTLATETPDYWLELGELAHILGRRNDAREAYRRFVALQPGNEEARHILRALCDEVPPARAPDACIRQLYSRFAPFYEDNMYGDLDYQAPDRLRELLDHQLQDRGGLDILELGCGTGLSGRILKPRASQLTGIDLSPQMVDKCHGTGLYDSLQVAEITAFLARAKPCSKRYDLIAACDTLIYFGDLAQVIGPASALLRPGGWIAFTVEKGEAPPFKLDDSGRFSHTAEHVGDVACRAGLRVACLEEGFLRYEYAEPVVGLLVLLEKPGNLSGLKYG
jgi:predicted TPR repeat methyltransferase